MSLNSKTNIIVPPLGESITEATIAKWYKKVGDPIKIDDILLELETEKVALEVNALSEGILENILKTDRAIVKVGEIVGYIDVNGKDLKVNQLKGNIEQDLQVKTQSKIERQNNINGSIINNHLSPSVNRIINENNIDPTNIQGTGKKGRITKEDALNYTQQNHIEKPEIEIVTNENINNAKKNTQGLSDQNTVEYSNGPNIDKYNRPTEIVKMSRLRRTTAQRLKESQNTAAILTTFNEVDMLAVMNIRKKYKDTFEKEHNIKLGFMSFFVKATIEALKQIPAVNAEIKEDNIIYKNYYDIGVAVGTEHGLVVPVIRDADKLSFAQVESTISQFGKKAKDGKLKIEELTGGTFTISNGGIYGSLLSTPIINPPQSGILGMHKIQERPVVIDGKIEIRPLMYLALSYDHRIIDGKEAVTFLVKIKEMIENPERILLSI